VIAPRRRGGAKRPFFEGLEGAATDPFSRMDAERKWTLVAQGALWSNLADG